MRSLRSKTAAAVFGLITALAVSIPAGVASASSEQSAAADTDMQSNVSLNGLWAPFTRCPVDADEMLAADGQEEIPQCLASSSAGGSMTIGDTTVPTGRTNLQFGLVEDTSEFSFVIVPPLDGAITAEPVKVPGGILGLMCPSDIPVISDICHTVVDNPLNKVMAAVEPAGAPSDFDLAAGTAVGEAIVTLPVKIHLQNPLLGSDCYIGSDADPIVLHPKNLTQPAAGFKRFDSDGTPNQTEGVMFRLKTSGKQGDDSFAVPGATGCGPLGLANGAINLKLGLPSPSGNNSLVLNDATTYLGGLNYPAGEAPNAGQVLSDYWHSAVLP